MPSRFEFTSELWLYPGEAAWHFVSLPKDISAQIKEMFGEISRGWGSLRVEVKIGKTKWKTSIFPDSKTNTYLLPVKIAIRNKEDIKVGDKVKVEINVLI